MKQRSLVNNIHYLSIRYLCMTYILLYSYLYCFILWYVVVQMSYTLTTTIIWSLTPHRGGLGVGLTDPAGGQGPSTVEKEMNAALQTDKRNLPIGLYLPITSFTDIRHIWRQRWIRHAAAATVVARITVRFSPSHTALPINSKWVWLLFYGPACMASGLGRALKMTEGNGRSNSQLVISSLVKQTQWITTLA